MEQNKTMPSANQPGGDTTKPDNPRGHQRGQTSRNEGEGNRTAARAYNDATERFAKSGRVEQGGQRARHAIEGDERGDLERAEEIGKSRMREEDPAIREKPARR